MSHFVLWKATCYLLLLVSLLFSVRTQRTVESLVQSFIKHIYWCIRGRLTKHIVTIRRDWDREWERERAVRISRGVGRRRRREVYREGLPREWSFPEDLCCKEIVAELCYTLSSINRKHSSHGCSFPPGSEPRKSRVLCAWFMWLSVILLISTVTWMLSSVYELMQVTYQFIIS